VVDRVVGIGRKGGRVPVGPTVGAIMGGGVHDGSVVRCRAAGPAREPRRPEGQARGAESTGQVMAGQSDAGVADGPDQEEEPEDVADEPGDAHEHPAEQQHDAVEHLAFGGFTPLDALTGVLDDTAAGAADEERSRRADTEQEDDRKEDPDVFGDDDEGDDLGRHEDEEGNQEHGTST
jgi:hypothetical protein